MTHVFFIFGVAVFLLLSWCWLRCLNKRLQCRRKLLRLCREKEQLRLHPRGKGWFLGSRYGKRCDFWVETPSRLYGVKLFGCIKRSKILMLREDGQYFFRGFASFLLVIVNAFDGILRMAPAYDFVTGAPVDAQQKEQRNVLLVNPAPMEMLYQPSSGPEQITGTGDHWQGMELASLSHLLRVLENAADEAAKSSEAAF